MFGRRRETFLLREIGEKRDKNREDPIYRKSQFLDGSRSIERYRELKTRALSVEELSRTVERCPQLKDLDGLK